MSTTAIKPSITSLSGRVLQGGNWLKPPVTHEDRLQRIEAIGQRIDGYIRFMCLADSVAGSSLEAKQRAVEFFYERMVVVEKQLGRIHEDFQLE